MSDEKITDTPTWPEAIRAAIASMLSDVHTYLPGRIESWDPKTQRADVKPLIKRVFYTIERDRKVEELPCIPNVKVLFPRTSTMFMSWPIKVGDHCEIQFTERSIDQFLAKQGGDTDPLDVRRFNLSDAVARVGFYPDSKDLADVHPDNIVIGEDGGIQIHIKPTGEIHLASENAAEFIALAGKTDQRISDLEQAVITLTNSQINVHLHMFPGALIPGPPGVTLPPVTMGTAPTPGQSVASGKVKSD